MSKFQTFLSKKLSKNDISKNKYKREYVQIKWHYMVSDLEFIDKYVK